MGAGLVALIFAALPGPARADEPVVARFMAGDEDLALAASDFADAAPMFFETGPGLFFQLSTEAEARFADLTGRGIGTRMSFHICEEPVVEAIIQGRLSGRGQVAVADEAQAMRYARILRGEIPC